MSVVLVIFDLQGNTTDNTVVSLLLISIKFWRGSPSIYRRSADILMERHLQLSNI
jgi:hypothetical protein